MQTPASLWRRRQAGLTLVELLVAVTLSTLIALAAVAALIVSRRGFTTVDASSQMRDNGRFASDMVRRLVSQAGFLDWNFAMVNRDTAKGDLDNPDPAISGFNNSKITSFTNPVGSAANESRPGPCSTDAGCSDVLIVRFQTQSVPGATNSDRSMIDCSGTPVLAQPLSRDDQSISIFYVDNYPTSTGEPTLMCLTGYYSPTAPTPYTWASAAVPVVTGVENFQVLYGVDGVEPNLALTAASERSDIVPNRYLRADQMVVSAAPLSALTYANWRRVRSVRVGIVLRGPTGSQQEFTPQTFYPFGMATSDGNAANAGLMMSTTDGAASPDKGTRFTPPTDGRLRQTLSFTVYLHNDVGLCVTSTCTTQ
jgi:type IV pilus assembly protein PilW